MIHNAHLIRATRFTVWDGEDGTIGLEFRHDDTTVLVVMGEQAAIAMAERIQSVGLRHYTDRALKRQDEE